MITYCNRLWKDVFIAETGNVYHCCHYGPDPVGNIYTNTLDEIVNSELARKFREKSLNGYLDCYHNCNLIDKETLQIKDMPLTTTFGRPKKLRIQNDTLCHLECIMCRQNHRNPTILELDTLIDAIDFRQFRIVEIQGGEPFFSKRSRMLIDYLISLGIPVSVLTNGMAINDQWAFKIAKSFASIKFSLNAGTKKTHELVNVGSVWERVLSNIDAIRDYKKLLCSQIHIRGHMTLVPANFHEIPLFILKAQELELEEIDFGYDKQSIPKYLEHNPHIVAKIKVQIKSTIADVEINMDIRRLQQLGLI